MSDFEYAIFFDITVLLDYCRTHLEECDPARDVIGAVKNDGGRVDISKNGWGNLNELVTNRQKLFKYLRDRATEHLRDFPEDEAEERYKANILTYAVLSEEGSIPFKLNERYLPDIEALHDCIDDMGLMQFRSYLDSQLTNFGRAYAKLDRLIDKKYHRGGRSSMMVEIVAEDFAESTGQYEGLLDAHFWADSQGKTVVIRDGAKAHENRDEFYERMWKTPSARRYILVSPEEMIEQTTTIQ